jgi:hypothetical protein
LAKKRAKRRSPRKGRHITVTKKPLLLAEVDPEAHGMHKSSGRIIYWLTVLLLAILNMLAALSVAVLQFAVSTGEILLIIAGLGAFFGYVSNKTISLSNDLLLRHHLFARIVIPAAAIINLVIITQAFNRLGKYAGIGHAHSPVLAGAAYAAGFALPSIIGWVAGSFKKQLK